ncbi:signal peptidase II [Chitinophaga terrae (ex Kim and Jung 2007)]|uniref:lipoprotein signal peptidase n=1 Tax=Chitinophaga terrae (ex Kim and Jung 2007) TaxID=408074 RepID=UPI0027810EE1|nr:lipoprotein signal peptidase [Chitinophaga terrae (ex Kim and Jung 2007)]MDQ0105232.1 signal peptidase II [Chitinophaga terrae (ex Kim and Jung 2007)]
MKYRHVIFIVALILIIDQTLKFWIKTHMFMQQEFIIFPNWFRIHFIENEGMAYGLKFGGDFGKILLTLFRLVAVVIGFVYMKKLVKEKYNTGLLVCGSLILAGAAGNLIDSMFYGLIFNDSVGYEVAKFLPAGGGYGSFLHGRVVDMLYFPIYEGYLPKWIPFKGGDYFVFFRPVFNIADAAISVGVITILLFQKRFFGHHLQHKTAGQAVSQDHAVE